MVAPCGKFTKASLVFSAAVAAIFSAVAASPSRGDSILLNDSFDSATQIGLNQDLNTRQTGTFAPMNYGSRGSAIYVSPNGNNTLWVLGQSDGLGAPTSANGIVWTGTNFNQNPGAGGYISVSADIFPSQNDPGNPSWLGLTIASGNMDSSPVSNVSQLGTIFRGNTYFEAYDSGSFIAGSTTQYNSNAGVAHHVEFRISDPTDGNPWNGSGETAIALYVDRSASPLWNFTKTGGGYTNNLITLWANANPGQTIIHQVDNFNVTSVIAVPEPGSLAIVGSALFGFVAYARRKRMTPA